MKRRRMLVAAVITTIALVAFPAGAAIAHRASRSSQGHPRRSPAQTLAVTCRSPALGGALPALVYLPAGRAGRALVGLSAGGYGAFNIGLRNLATFGAVESWSGYFAATDPTGLHVLNLGSAAANSEARVPSGNWLKAEQARWPSLIAFYVGNQDSRFLTMNQAFDRALHASAVSHTFRIYSGGHSGALWRAQAPHWLGMALDALAAEAHRRAG